MSSTSGSDGGAVEYSWFDPDPATPDVSSCCKLWDPQRAELKLCLRMASPHHDQHRSPASLLFHSIDMRRYDNVTSTRMLCDGLLFAPLCRTLIRRAQTR
jgi:hypothetical protein